MPPTVLIALVLAFGLDLGRDPGPVPAPEAARRSIQVATGVALLAVAGFLAGSIIARKVRRGGDSAASSRWLVAGARSVDVLALGAFAWTLYGVGWPGVVESTLGLRGAILLDEVLILLPFLIGQVAAWAGLELGERTIRAGRGGPEFATALLRKARQSLGLIVPAALVYTIGHDVLRSRFPEISRNPWAGLALTAGLGALVLILSPFFVRLTFPTRRLPDGLLRDRLLRLSGRLGFRCSEILVWETGGSVVNAGVTGAVPWFRYVLITDGLIAGLEGPEIEAVFGHEVGHIAHRHLVSFGLFFLGSLGVLALATVGLDRLFPEGSPLWRSIGDPAWIAGVQASAELAMLGLYLYFVFGPLSRGLERQADLYGARAVSCSRPDCPPHPDPNHPGSGMPPLPDRPCPVGLRIFANALIGVARLNGIDPDARSWRHGSIRRRVEFLERLEFDPLAGARFQSRVRRVRIALVVLLGSAVAWAACSGALEQLG